MFSLFLLALALILASALIAHRRPTDPNAQNGYGPGASIPLATRQWFKSGLGDW